MLFKGWGTKLHIDVVPSYLLHVLFRFFFSFRSEFSELLSLKKLFILQVVLQPIFLREISILSCQIIDSNFMVWWSDEGFQ